jgi:hypothetical protein
MHVEDRLDSCWRCRRRVCLTPTARGVGAVSRVLAPHLVQKEACFGAMPKGGCANDGGAPSTVAARRNVAYSAGITSPSLAAKTAYRRSQSLVRPSTASGASSIGSAIRNPPALEVCPLGTEGAGRCEDMGGRLHVQPAELIDRALALCEVATQPPRPKPTSRRPKPPVCNSKPPPSAARRRPPVTSSTSSGTANKMDPASQTPETPRTADRKEHQDH